MKLTTLLFGLKGRIGRAQWWLASIAATVVNEVLSDVTAAILAPVKGPDPATAPTLAESARRAAAIGEAQGEHAPILGLFFLVWLYVIVALGVKRCHDRNKSGWLMLLMLVPVLGWIWLLIDLGMLPGTEGANRFGPAAKASGDAPLDGQIEAGPG